MPSSDQRIELLPVIIIFFSHNFSHTCSGHLSQVLLLAMNINKNGLAWLGFAGNPLLSPTCCYVPGLYSSGSTCIVLSVYLLLPLARVAREAEATFQTYRSRGKWDCTRPTYVLCSAVEAEFGEGPAGERQGTESKRRGKWPRFKLGLVRIRMGRKLDVSSRSYYYIATFYIVQMSLRV